MPGDKWFPLEGADLVAHWGFVFDVPDEVAGGFVSGEILLRSDRALLRRYSRSTYADGHTTYRYGPWARMPSRPDTADAGQTIELLRAQGYRLCRPFVGIEEHESVPVPGFPGAVKEL